MASTSGLRWTGSAQVAYAATKAGVIQLSRVVAVQHAAQGVRVNTVVPGQLHTPMVEARLARQRAGGDVEALLAQRQKRIPLGFMGDGRDTAAAVLFLASDADPGKRHPMLLPLLPGVLAGVGGAFAIAALFNLYVWFEVMLICAIGLFAIVGRVDQLAASFK